MTEIVVFFGRNWVVTCHGNVEFDVNSRFGIMVTIAKSGLFN